MGTITIPDTSDRRAPVHPHGRGDNGFDVDHRQRAVGSPPRAWGQCRHPQSPRIAQRFTPTGVGTIARSQPIIGGEPVHPHGRGDNRYRVGRDASRAGSPPRAWGQSIVSAGEDRNLRFTPTGVGTISPALAPVRRRAVHPHGRGDNARCTCVRCWTRGSPPRAWGQFCNRLPSNSLGRFTPTGVGTMQ